MNRSIYSLDGVYIKSNANRDVEVKKMETKILYEQKGPNHHFKATQDVEGGVVWIKATGRIASPITTQTFARIMEQYVRD